MKSEIILDAIGGIRAEYIAEAEQTIGMTKKKNSRVWLKWGALAACAAVAVFCGTRILPQYFPVVNDDELPLLTIGENMSGGMGYEGLLAYDVSELVNANPWTEKAKLDRLPVYKNQLYYDENYLLRGHDPEAMQEFLLEVAERLGMDTESLMITDNTPSAEEQESYRKRVELTGWELPEDYFDPTIFTVEDDTYEVEVDQQMCVTIHFKEPVALPEQYNFSDGASYEELYNTAEYLMEEYSALIAMDDPQINISGGDYNIYGVQSYTVEFYEGKGNLTEQIQNYSFDSVIFYGDSEGKLWLARVNMFDREDSLGNYPIISADEAREILLDGGYITTVPFEMPGEDYISAVELVYRNGLYDEYFMPYYRFLIELPEATVLSGTPEGLKTYGAYYVPAVESKYITDMPVWDGSFN